LHVGLWAAGEGDWQMSDHQCLMLWYLGRGRDAVLPPCEILSSWQGEMSKKST